MPVNGPLEFEPFKKVGDDEQGADVAADSDHGRVETGERRSQRFELSRRFEVVLAAEVGDHALADPATVPVGLNQFQVRVGLVAPFHGDTFSEHVVHTLTAGVSNYKLVITTVSACSTLIVTPLLSTHSTATMDATGDPEQRLSGPGTQSYQRIWPTQAATTSAQHQHHVASTCGKRG